MREIDAVYLPSIGSDDALAESLPVVISDEVIVRARVRLAPPFGDDENSRWYVPQEHVE